MPFPFLRSTALSAVRFWGAQIPSILLFPLVAFSQLQDFTYATNNGGITILSYTGAGGSVTIPDSVGSLPVVAIGDNVFKQHFNVTAMSIPSTVTSIGNWAFAYTSVTNLVIPDSVTNLGDYVAYSCYPMLSVIIGGSVANIGQYAFSDCTHLQNITLVDGVGSIGTNAFADDNFGSLVIPGSVTNLAYESLAGCYNLSSLYFEGDAPYVDPYAFYSTPGPATAYYLPTAAGWQTTLGVHPALPTAIWMPLQIPTDDGNFGFQNNQFGFTVTGSVNDVVVVEACTNLANPVWSYVNVATLTGGTSGFLDPKWTNYPSRFYRIRSR